MKLISSIENAKRFGLILAAMAALAATPEAHAFGAGGGSDGGGSDGGGGGAGGGGGGGGGAGGGDGGDGGGRETNDRSDTPGSPPGSSDPGSDQGTLSTTGTLNQVPVTQLLSCWELNEGLCR